MANVQNRKTELDERQNGLVEDLAWVSAKLKSVAPALALWMMVQYCFKERIVFPLDSMDQLASSLVVLLLLALMLVFYLGFGLMLMAWIRHFLSSVSKFKDAKPINEKADKIRWRDLLLDVFAAIVAGFFLSYTLLIANLEIWQVFRYLFGSAAAGFLFVLILDVPTSNGRRMMAAATSFVLTILLLVVINVQRPATDLALQILGIRSAPSDTLIFSSSAKRTIIDLQDPDQPLSFCKIGESSQGDNLDEIWTFENAQLLWGVVLYQLFAWLLHARLGSTA